MDNKILIIGLGVSGKSAAKVISKKGFDVYAYDDNITELSKTPKELEGVNVKYLFNSHEVYNENFSLVMKSPGINPENPLVVSLKEMGTKIISDIELGYLLKGKEKIIGVTGTNGKTTTTVLINEILKGCGISSDAVGNIGVGAVSELINTKKDVLVVECSSFQLDDIDKFKPDISVITNISSDHLDYHQTVRNYQNAKLNIVKNLNPGDYAVLNFDDKVSKTIDGSFKKIYFSGKEILKNGIYLDDKFIYFGKDGDIEKYINLEDIKIKGVHNYYNIMCAIGVSEILNLDRNKVIEVIKGFQGVPHRLQFVKEIEGVSYYNDSKGTNSDSTMKAISAFDSPIIILLGGYDKKSDFKELLEFGKNKIKSIIAMGETKEKILLQGKSLGYKDIFDVNSLEEGVSLAKDLSVEGDIVLLSPACASWDVFKNFEERGNKFIQLVESL